MNEGGALCDREEPQTPYEELSHAHGPLRSKERTSRWLVTFHTEARGCPKENQEKMRTHAASPEGGCKTQTQTAQAPVLHLRETATQSHGTLCPSVIHPSPPPRTCRWKSASVSKHSEAQPRTGGPRAQLLVFSALSLDDVAVGKRNQGGKGAMVYIHTHDTEGRVWLPELWSIKR